MYENVTYEVILERLLSSVPDTMDKREGSVIFDALAPAAVEMQNMYIELDTILNETFADTASREYLIKRASERGLTPKAATYAVLKAVFTPSTLNIPIGQRFSLEDLNYVITAKVSDGVYQVTCETAGEAGNSYFGNLIPIEYVQGLQSAELSELLIPGENDEDTEVFRQRYFESLDSQAFGGNVADYQEKTKSLDGVGGVKVTPVWNGGGTVKLTIIDSTFGVPSATLISAVQTAIDPTQNSGTGAGLAPIGHVVTVAGVSSTTINLTATLTLQSGWAWTDVKDYVEAAIDAYYLELAESWEDEDAVVVRISQLETRILNCTGVIDIADTTINGVASNLTLDSDKIPVRGSFNGI